MECIESRFIIFSYHSQFDSGNYPLKLNYNETKDSQKLFKIIRNLHCLISPENNIKSSEVESRVLNGVFSSVKEENQNEINKLKSEILDYMMKEKKMKKEIENLKKELDKKDNQNNKFTKKK